MLIAKNTWYLKLVWGPTFLILFSACAHQPTQDANSGQLLKKSSSVSWPLLPLNEIPRATDDNLKEAEKVPPNLAAQPVMPQASQTPVVQTAAVQGAPPQVQKAHGANSPLAAPEIAKVDKPVEKPALEIDKHGRVSNRLKPSSIKFPKPKNAEAAMDTPLIFDIPVAYNSRVKYWIEYFQTNGRPWYTKWLERSSRYLPLLQKTLKKNGLPQDLAYIAMIESGFSSQASSAAKAVGPWQFIRETATHYGLKVTWWLDERRDFQKSTEAAAKYLKKMYGMFHNWYLVAAGYNTGEHRIKRVIEKQGTRNFWKIAQKSDLESETRDYVPKLIAALLIAKAPQMYGFNKINYTQPLSFETIRAPGGTRLDEIADAIGVTASHMRELNPELVRGYVPSYVETHPIRIPKGSYQLVQRFFRRSMVSEN